MEPGNRAVVQWKESGHWALVEPGNRAVVQLMEPGNRAVVQLMESGSRAVVQRKESGLWTLGTGGAWKQGSGAAKGVWTLGSDAVEESGHWAVMQWKSLDTGQWCGSPSNLMEFGSLPLSPCFWLALSLLSWGYLVFSNVVDLCCATFMLSL